MLKIYVHWGMTNEAWAFREKNALKRSEELIFCAYASSHGMAGLMLILFVTKKLSELSKIQTKKN